MTIFILSGLLSCRPEENERKIFYINSYHQGYPSSDDITGGIKEVLADKPVDLRIFYMDTKRNNGDDFIAGKTLEVLDEIRQFDPDLIIASDDNAVKYVIEPHFKDKTLPVIFCGVNWSAEQYGLPTDNITGILEILPVKEGINFIRSFYPEVKLVTILSEDTESERKNIGYISSLVEKMGLTLEYKLAGDFEEWKDLFSRANRSSDLIYMPTNGAVKNWDHQQAVDFVKSNTRVPTLTCDDFMMPYVVIGFTKLQEEQGTRAAEMALSVLEGEKISGMPVQRNRDSQIWYNPLLGEKIDFNEGEADLSGAMIYKY